MSTTSRACRARRLWRTTPTHGQTGNTTPQQTAGQQVRYTRVARWTGKSPRRCREDATRKMVPWNFCYKQVDTTDVRVSLSSHSTTPTPTRTPTPSRGSSRVCRCRCPCRCRAMQHWTPTPTSLRGRKDVGVRRSRVGICVGVGVVECQLCETDRGGGALAGLGGATAGAWSGGPGRGGSVAPAAGRRLPGLRRRDSVTIFLLLRHVAPGGRQLTDRLREVLLPTKTREIEN